MLGKNDRLTELYCRISGGALRTYSVFYVFLTPDIHVFYVSIKYSHYYAIE